MRKDVGLILAAAVCFDLGVVVVPAHAATQAEAETAIRNSSNKAIEYLKVESLPLSFSFAKIEIDYIAAANACVKAKGKLFEWNGQKFCGTEKSGPTPSPQKK